MQECPLAAQKLAHRKQLNHLHLAYSYLDREQVRAHRQHNGLSSSPKTPTDSIAKEQGQRYQCKLQYFEGFPTLLVRQLIQHTFQ